MTVPCAPLNSKKSLVGGSFEAQQALYQRSISDPDGFWSELASREFYWKQRWAAGAPVHSYNFSRKKGRVFAKWFEGGVTNICYNALDRHAEANCERVCFYWEGNDPSRRATVTYGSLLEEVVRVASVLRDEYHIVKGDVVALYLPMIPMSIAAVMACARIGAVCMVVFAGFSAESLANRLADGKPKVVITVDASFRGTKPILLKKIVDEALGMVKGDLPSLRCLVYANEGKQHCEMLAGRDAWYDELSACLQGPLEGLSGHAIEWVESEDPLFILYTSGSTGKPKAVVHTTGGYMVNSATTFRYTFDYHAEDVYFCTADVGWITGHSYVVYGPMLNGATSVLFEGTYNYPTLSRWWELLERYKVTSFYTAPTAVRMIRKHGEEPIRKHDLSALRILGSVGEPISVETWKWFYDVVGGRHVDIVDTYWQTETGAFMLTGLPGCTPMKPGCASVPMLGVEPVLLDPQTLQEVKGEGSGLLAFGKPWPGISRTLLGEHSKYEELYFSADGYYLSGDGARRDADGYYWITGRVDDVLNVSGHRLGTSEIENAINTHPSVIESAVVGVPHTITGESVYAYFVVGPGVKVTAELMNELKLEVRRHIGPIAVPGTLHPAPGGLPKTRSGKIVRRMLRKIALKKDNDLGDVSTLLDPKVIPQLIASRKEWVEGGAVKGKL